MKRETCIDYDQRVKKNTGGKLTNNAKSKKYTKPRRMVPRQ